MADTISNLFAGLVQVKMVFASLDTQEIGYARNAKNQTVSYSLEDGSGSGQAETVYAAQRTVAAGGLDSIDLTNLTQETLGASVPFSFDRLRIIRIANKSQTAGEYLYFGADATNPTTNFAVAVGAGSEALIVNQIDHYEVVSGNEFLNTYNPNPSPVSYELYLIGSEA